MGHTMSVHSRNEQVILEFGLRKPAFRICVNTPTTHGSIGLTTGLDPAMTLGCGGWGGNITSDNISPRHLLNIKRLAYEVRPAPPSAVMAGTSALAADRLRGADATPAQGALPKAPVPYSQPGISAQTLAARIDAFLTSRGYKPAEVRPEPEVRPTPEVRLKPDTTYEQAIADFICEDDVRSALRAGRKLLIGEKTIITPAARDLGEAEKVFVHAGWPR
jgi:hypothetical protein